MAAHTETLGEELRRRTAEACNDKREVILDVARRVIPDRLRAAADMGKSQCSIRVMLLSAGKAETWRDLCHFFAAVDTYAKCKLEECLPGVRISSATRPEQTSIVFEWV